MPTHQQRTTQQQTRAAGGGRPPATESDNLAGLRALHDRLTQIPRGEAVPHTNDEVTMARRDADAGCPTCRVFLHAVLRGEAAGRINELQDRQRRGGKDFVGWTVGETPSQYKARLLGPVVSADEQARGAEKAARAVVATSRRQPGETVATFVGRVQGSVAEAAMSHVRKLPGEDSAALLARQIAASERAKLLAEGKILGKDASLTAQRVAQSTLYR
jgi:hypothetical protein